MKILVLSDIHSRKENLEKLMEKAKGKEIELILIAGDLTNFGGEIQTKEVLDIVKKMNKKILAVPGNLDSKKATNYLEKEKISLHGKKEKFGEFTFIGLGGATNCIGDTVLTEKEVYEKLKELIKEEKEKVFLLTHSPPKNSSLDKNFYGKAIGSESVRRIIEEFFPEINVSGHCHEGLGEETINKTFCVNPGAVKEGKMCLIDSKTKKTERISL